MAVQSVQDNGSVKGSLDLGDQVTITKPDGRTNTITVEQYLSATTSGYDGNLPPNLRLANVLKMADRYPVSSSLFDFLNDRTAVWNENHPANQTASCPENMSFVKADGRRVTQDFCIDNKATNSVKDKYPTWQEAVDFCEAAGKFLLSYEQHRLGARSTDSTVVESSGRLEWLLKSNGEDSRGQSGGFFNYGNYRHFNGGYLSRYDPDKRDYDFAYRCGAFRRPRTDL